MMHSPETVTSFEQALARIIKPANIVSDTTVLERYSRDGSFIAGSRPLLLVYPKSKDEVREIVKLANESKMPLVPVSSGTPRFHGDTVPSQSGIIMDFGRMKRIIKIDALNRCVMVEPGVTYRDLIPAIREHGLKLNIPFLPKASKSIATSRLEREPVLIPKYQYDYVDPLLTLEVIYGTGDEFRTGSASGPGDLEYLKADKVNPWGPGSIDYFRFLSGAQGTMGLVTWVMVKTEILPSIQKLYFIPSTDIGELSKLMISLLRKRVVDECLALNNVSLATILADDWPDDYQELKKCLPPWTVIVCVAGYQRRPEQRAGIMEKYLFDICKDLNLTPQISLPGAEGKEKTVLELLSNPWQKQPYWKLRHKGSTHDIFFLTPLSKAADFTGLIKGVVAKHRYSYDDMGSYIQPMVQGRGCHCEFNLPCDESDVNEVSGVKRLFLDASETLVKNGAFFSRPYGPWSEMVYHRDAQGVAALKKLKTLFDPNDILNPGKLCF
jgi:FAD/FMN-containing dehydrogenase